jgi:hypothetical protein
MKFLSALAIVLQATIVTCSAQNRIYPVSQPTTEEEYNYVTKGYPTQIADGLDMKKGYSFKDIGTLQQGNYTFTFKGLLRETTNEIAAELIIVKSLAWNKTYYICIPHGNDNLANRYASDIGSWDVPLTKAYCQILSLAWGASSANMYEYQKRWQN